MITWQDKKAVEVILIDIISYGLVEKFYPTFVAKKLCYPLSSVFEILNIFVGDKMLILEWEVRCAECGRTLNNIKDLSSLKDYYSCRYCDEDVEITLENVFPIYSFENEYKKHIMDCKHKQISKKKMLYVLMPTRKHQQLYQRVLQKLLRKKV